MPSFKNLKEFERFLQKQINNALQNEVKNEVEETMRDHIQKDVYEAYTPYSTDGVTPHYERTYELLRSIESNLVDNGVLSVENTRHEGDRDIVSVIEYGQGYQWGYVRNLDEEIGARPFVENTRHELEQTNKHVEALKKGLKRQGIDVE